MSRSDENSPYRQTLFPVGERENDQEWGVLRDPTYEAKRDEQKGMSKT